MSSPRGVRFEDDASSLPVDQQRDTIAATMEGPSLLRNESSASASSGESDPDALAAMSLGRGSDDDIEDPYSPFSPGLLETPQDDVPPMMNSSVAWGYNGPMASMHRSAPGGSVGAGPGIAHIDTNISNSVNIGVGSAGAGAPRSARPAAVRTPSNAYAPARRPGQYSVNTRHRNSSANRNRRNPNVEYRAQEKAYVQRIRKDGAEMDSYENGELRTPSLGYSTDTDSDDESPSTADYFENEFDQDTMLWYGNDDMQPTVEDLKIPANRERLEWHSMLASVLTGDVVKQEKKRLIGSGDQQADSSLRMELWTGIRARVCGRTMAAQRKMLDDGRAQAKLDIESIIAFEIKGEAEVGKSAAEQVDDMIKKIERCECLYPNIKAMEAGQPRAASQQYKDSRAAIIAWYSTMQCINTELSILRSWVGNDELDFMRPRTRSSNDSHLVDDSSFIDRVLKEDRLKSLQNTEGGLLVGLHIVIRKAKATLIENAEAFGERHLPPYMEELQTLINFPSRLVQEIISVRLSYAKKVKDPVQQGVLMAEQMIGQFQILLELAVRVKATYLEISHPADGWDPPACIEENFDTTVLDALRFYFRMLDKKLSANKNTFKEAEILEQEWEFANKLGRHLEGGDIEVAEQFSSLTWASMRRLANNFERELQKKPEEIQTLDVDRRYKQILDAVRVRQRKLFRFSRILSQKFENSTEYNINFDPDHMFELQEALELSGHLLVERNTGQSNNIYILASPALADRQRDVQSILSMSYHPEERPEDPSIPYVIILKPEKPFNWTGRRMEVDMRIPHLDLKTNRLRLVADGGQQRLINANMTFSSVLGMDLTVVVEQRSNLGRINSELTKIKKTVHKLSNTIMDSVEIIRKQTHGLDCQELIQTCFAFATEFGQRSVLYMDYDRRALNNLKLTRLALDWVSFICDDCIPSDRKTFRWAVVALEFAMLMTRGQNILYISEQEYAKLRAKVAGCMSLLISHFDIMGARSTMAAQAEKQRMDAMSGKSRLDFSRLKEDEESISAVREQWLAQLEEIDMLRKSKEGERQALGKVLENSSEADRALTYLSSSATNVTMRWTQGQYVGGGTFGSVYVAQNLDTNQLMAVKEIRLQDPQLIPTIVAQIRDEMSVLQVLDHPNIVSYYGIEPHRDKVYIFMEYCSDGSLASLLEHGGRIEDEMVIQVYTLQMLEGLAYLHERGVVHRDIKPESKSIIPVWLSTLANKLCRHLARP